MRIFKFLLLILLIAPINAFGACDYDDETECNNNSNYGCYWKQESKDLTTGIVTPSGCETCLLGSYIENGKCEKCPMGYYCMGNGQKTLCPAGTYSDKTEQIACTPCPAGTYSGDEGRTSECTDKCKEPLILAVDYTFGFSGVGKTATSCPWIFSCDEGKYPECDIDKYSCICKTCGASYEVLEKPTKISFNDGVMEPDPDSSYACLGNFRPLELVSNPESLPDAPVGDVKDFEFYAIIKDEQVFISATEDLNPENYETKNITIQNVKLSNGLDYYVNLSIGDCKFETDGCGKSSKTECTITVSDESCTADQLRQAAGDEDKMTLKTEWGLDVPVLIAKDKLEFDDNKLYIEYTVDDNDCFQWAKNIGEVETPSNPLPVGDCSANEDKIKEDLNGYNTIIGNIPFLGYTIGCWKKEAANSLHIMLEDFKDPDDCSTRSVLTKDPGEFTSLFASSIEGKNWPGIDQVYNYSNIDQANPSNTDKRCFIVGIYGYPPCTPGCYCPGGTSKSCADSPSPFTSNRGSVNRSECYLKPGVAFIEGGEPVTDSVKGLLGLSEESYKDIRLE